MPPSKFVIFNHYFFNHYFFFCSELVIDHIALWLAPQKCALINSIQDSMFEKQISLTKLNTIGGDFNWQNKIDMRIKDAIIKKNNNYTTYILGLVKFVQNMIKHGHTIFSHVSFFTKLNLF